MEKMTLADLRRQAGMTQEQVAVKMRVGQKQVSRIEAAYPNINFTTLCRYMEAIGGRTLLDGPEGSRDAMADMMQDPAREVTRRSRQSDSTRGRSRVTMQA